MKTISPFKTEATLLYLDAVFFLERVNLASKANAKKLALCWLDFWIEHDVKNTEKHKAVKKHLARM
jgi:hypothetical protein